MDTFFYHPSILTHCVRLWSPLGFWRKINPLLFFPTPNFQKFIPSFCTRNFRTLYAPNLINYGLLYRCLCKNTFHCHYAQQMSKDYVLFAATRKALKKFMPICLLKSPYVCPFLSLNWTCSWLPPFFLKIPPFGSPPKIAFQVFSFFFEFSKFRFLSFERGDTLCQETISLLN